MSVEAGNISVGRVRIYSGDGSPEGVVIAAAGSVYLRRLGGKDTTLYLKEAGGGATGWVAVPTSSGLSVAVFGAKGDGTTDDTAAIQATIDAATAAGGGVIHFPAGTYKIVKLGSQNYALDVHGDNLIFRGVGPQSILKTSSGTGNGFGFFIHGAGKVNGMADWANHTYHRADVTRYTINPAARSAISVTTTTAADAGNFAAGDIVYIRTGQTIDATPGTDEPDAEINMVLSADAGTGVIVLRWPLAKPYAQEYYVSGTSGITTTTVTANAAPLCISKVSARTIRNIEFRDLGIDDAMPEGFAAVAQVLGLRMTNCVGTYRNGVLNAGDYRQGIFTGNRLHGTGGGTSAYYVAFTGAKGTTDVIIGDNILTADGNTGIHIAEGNAQMKIRNNIFMGHPNTNMSHVIGGGSRAYDMSITDNTIVNGGGNAAVFFSTQCDGVVRGNTIRGTGFSTPISISSPGMLVEGNQIDPALAVPGSVQYPSGARGGSERPMEMVALSAWVRYNRQTAVLGTLGGRFVITNVFLYLNQAFNSDGTDYLTLGYSGGSATRYMGNTDVSGAVGVVTPAAGTIPFGTFEGADKREIVAYYANGGSEPTTGRVLVTVIAVQVPEDQ